MKITLLTFASLVFAAGCSTPASTPDGGHATTSGGSTSSGGSSGGGSTGGGGSSGPACPVGAGCTLTNGTAGACCSTGCVDTATDAQNCGGCGNLCPSGATCIQGYCTASSCSGASPSLSCTLPDGGAGDCCAGACLDPQASFNSDPKNCGGCGAACETGSLCQQGQCALSDGGSGYCNVDGDCPSGDTCNANGCQPSSCAGASSGAVCALAATASDSSGICCSSACVDSQWDNQNCGGCGLACSGSEDCNYGVCVPHVACGASTLGATCLVSNGLPGTCCGSACVDTTSDSSNCGGCAQACPTGGTCQAGSCALADGGAVSCTPPMTGCPSGTLCAANGCLPATCSGSGGFCFLGLQSPAGICCGGNCVDPTQDPSNCGGCGVTCGSGLCVYTGNSGICIPSGSGGCTKAGGCPSGESCVGGQCQQTDCSTFATDLCAASDNAPGVCCYSFGNNGLTASCADPATDPNNCGGCGFACPSGQTCAKGLCSGTVAPCAVGHIEDGCELGGGPYGICCPGGGCSDVTTDVNNCGYCGNPCSSGQTCVAGNCM